jgi:hypothetical protein
VVAVVAFDSSKVNLRLRCVVVVKLLVVAVALFLSGGKLVLKDPLLRDLIP